MAKTVWVSGMFVPVKTVHPHCTEHLCGCHHQPDLCLLMQRTTDCYRCGKPEERGWAPSPVIISAPFVCGPLAMAGAWPTGRLPGYLWGESLPVLGSEV